jgi:hypothetical protein
VKGKRIEGRAVALRRLADLLSGSLADLSTRCLVRRYGTLQSQERRMTEENVQDLQDKALGQYIRMKKNLAVTKERIGHAAKEMESLALDLKNKPFSHWLDSPFHKYVWLDSEGLSRLLAEVLRAEKDLETARSKAMSLGAAIELAD